MGMNLNNPVENPEVVFEGVTGPNWQRQGAFFWLDKLENPVYSPPLIFIEVEVQDKVTIINQKQYEDIVGPMPQIYNRSDQIPPTPTSPGYTPPAYKTPCR